MIMKLMFWLTYDLADGALVREVSQHGLHPAAHHRAQQPQTQTHLRLLVVTATCTMETVTSATKVI
jgi:hypothetical protein